jgi:transposase
VWSPKGQRPIGSQVRKYEWIYAYAFVHPKSGKSFWLLLPSVNTLLMNMALKEFSLYVDPQQEKKILLLIDGAGFHTGNGMEIPENIKLFPLPPYTPELQPTESAWPLLRESVANDCYQDLDTFEAQLASRCKWLINHSETVRGKVGFSWIQEIECSTD